MNAIAITTIVDHILMHAVRDCQQHDQWHLASLLVLGHALLPDTLAAVLVLDESLGMDIASARGDTRVLDAWLSAFPRPRRLSAFYSEQAIFLSAQHGRLDSLQWWLRRHQSHGIELKVGIFDPHAEDSCLPLDVASKGGYLGIIQWWWDTAAATPHGPLAFDYSCFAVGSASEHGRCKVLEFWWQLHVEHGVPFKFTEAIFWASVNNHRPALDWWTQWHTRTGQPLCFDYYIYDADDPHGDDGDPWYRFSGVQPAVERAVDCAAIDVLGWWAEMLAAGQLPSGSLPSIAIVFEHLPARGQPVPLDLFSAIEWCAQIQQDHGVKIIVDPGALDHAAELGHKDVLSTMWNAHIFYGWAYPLSHSPPAQNEKQI